MCTRTGNRLQQYRQEDTGGGAALARDCSQLLRGPCRPSVRQGLINNAVPTPAPNTAEIDGKKGDAMCKFVNKKESLLI